MIEILWVVETKNLIFEQKLLEFKGTYGLASRYEEEFKIRWYHDFLRPLVTPFLYGGDFMRKELAEKLLPGLKHDVKYYENLYPKRNLADGAIVTRYAPSPTGFVHIGNLFQLYISGKLARQTKGVNFLRIEDTDQERLVENGIDRIINDVKAFNITFDEGPINQTEQKGEYGPYIQSQRKEIYQTYAKDLLLKDLAYPDFTTKEEVEAMRKEQVASKRRIGYYGKWARSRFLSEAEIEQNLKENKPYIIRLRNMGDYNRKITFVDAIKGRIEFPEDDIDQVIIKNDGLPTYHFAHVIDDHLMQTTHVIRGDEWLSSVPIHLNLFKTLGFTPPTYAHIPPLSKKEGNTVRKLSKRKDPELAVSYYDEKGIPAQTLMLYLATVANSNFEEWYQEHPDEDIENFNLTFEKIGTSAALFDMEKLLNISKNILSKMTALEIYQNTLNWAQKYDEAFAKVLEANQDIAVKTLNIERESAKPRKDFSMYSEVKENIYYMFDELFTNESYEWQKITDLTEIKEILNVYLDNYYDPSDDEEVWFNKIKEMCDKLGYAANMKEYKKNPENFKGNVADVSTVIRVALTTKARTPNLYDIMQILGTEKIKDRFSKIK